MSSGEDIRLLEELENLLEKQMVLARRGSFAAVLQLAGRCEPLVAKIAAAGLFEKPEHKASNDRLADLYKDLHLLLSSQQSAAAEQLKSVRKGKKTLAVYRNNI
jgi:hypothetical protein